MSMDTTGAGEVELYNLKDDLGERRELSAEHPETRDRLLAELHAWQKELGAKKATPNPEAP